MNHRMLQKPQTCSVVQIVSNRNHLPISLPIKFFISPQRNRCLDKRYNFQTRTSISTSTKMASLTASGPHWVNGKIGTCMVLGILILRMSGSMSNKASCQALSPWPIRVCQPIGLASILQPLLPALKRITLTQNARSLQMRGITARQADSCSQHHTNIPRCLLGTGVVLISPGSFSSQPVNFHVQQIRDLWGSGCNEPKRSLRYNLVTLPNHQYTKVSVPHSPPSQIPPALQETAPTGPIQHEMP